MAILRTSTECELRSIAMSWARPWGYPSGGPYGGPIGGPRGGPGGGGPGRPGAAGGDFRTPKNPLFWARIHDYSH